MLPITNRMFRLNTGRSILLIFLFGIIALLTTVHAELTLRVGPSETYATITEAVSAIPQPANEDVRIQVVIPSGGYDEDDMILMPTL